MNKAGMKFYFDKLTGRIIASIGESNGTTVLPSTIDDDILAFKELSGRNRDTFDVIELEYGQYAKDFSECVDFRINLETKELEFSYPSLGEVQPNIPQYVMPLTEQIKVLEDRQVATEEAISFLLGL